MRRLRAILVGGCLLPGAIAHGQSPLSPPAMGSRLRVWSRQIPHNPVVGTLLQMDSAQLTVQRTSNSIIVPWRLVDSLQVSRGHQSGRGRKGALIGALVGGAFCALLADATDDGSNFFGHEFAVTVASIGGVLGGAFVGAIVGSARARERWEPVPLGSRGRAGTRHSRIEVGFSVGRVRVR